MEPLAALREAAEAVQGVLGRLESRDEWGPTETIPGQYRSDLLADAAAVDLLTGHGFGVLSEESGHHHPERAVVVVVDPLDGSTNASQGIPWYATSLCAVDAEGPLAAVVLNLADGTRFEAERGVGATRDGAPIAPSSTDLLAAAIVVLSGYPPRWLGWKQYRVMGAAALDICAVADGTFDAFIDCSTSALGPWDYLGALLVARESGAVVVDALGRELVVVEHPARRTPVAANPALLAEAVAARQGW